MENKFVDWALTILLWILVIAFVVGVLWLFIGPIVRWTELSEFRLYIRAALVMLAVIAFGVLRIYNSHVQNTRVLFKVHQELNKALAELPVLQRSLHNLGIRTDSLRNGIVSNTKGLGELSADAKEVLTALKQRKSAPQTPKNNG